MRRAFSYVRFSTDEQKDGRSLKRQEEAAKAYCKRHGLTLDERTYHDLGISGYHGANATHGKLGEFLELIREGRIPEGSVLIVENVDRLSRLPPNEASDLIMSIVKAGVDVVTTSPEQRYTATNICQIGTWIPLQVAHCLASEESRKKGERVADAWADKRSRAAAEKLTKRGPAWLKITADRKGWTVIEPKADWIRRMFRLAAEGHGTHKISGVLNAECPEGLTGRGWEPGTVADLLRSRTVLGEYQPHVGTCARKGRQKTRKAVGGPVKDYYPAILSEAEFYRTQAALDGRKRGGGRATGTPNLFNGILFDAFDGRRMVLNSSGGRKVLVSSGAVRKDKGSAFRVIRYEVFEPAILTRLAELKPADVLGKAGEAEDQVAALSGKLTAINRKLEAVRAKAAEADDVTVFFDLLADLDRQRKALAEELDEAKAEATNQEGDNLGEFTSLVELLDAADPAERDELRRKTQAALRRLVKEMYCVIVTSKENKLVAVQCWFDDTRHRDFLICHRPRWSNGKARREGGWWARSLADAGKFSKLDLRDQAHAARLEKALARLDLDVLTEG
jgi:DNA invertase Pin-like site-specific DNA recombinase